MAESNLETISRRYRRFAKAEAAGSSPIYERLANAIADYEPALRYIANLPPERQQPNLLLAAVRWVAGLQPEPDRFFHALAEHEHAVRAVMLARTTQTNEPARCAALFPVLARLEQPLALIEVGASAGLCLFPDRYGYAYGSHTLSPKEPAAAPLFSCEVTGSVPLPAAMPRVIWRRGLDLNPLDARTGDARRWLENLVWPEHSDRLAGLRAALALAAAEEPIVEAGNLLEDLPRLALQAPADARLVVFHSAVVSYVADKTARARFAETVKDLGGVWISNEVPGTFPAIAAKAGPQPLPGWFLLAVDGEPVAWTHPHGRAIQWIG